MKKSTEPESGTGRLSDLVLFKSNAFWICNKPAGMPVLPDKTGDPSLMDLVRRYARHGFQPVHRLDRPVSGLTILAGNKAVATSFSEMFREGRVEKTYLAVTESRPEADSGRLEHHLVASGRTHKSYIADSPGEGTREAVLTYRYLGSSERYHLLEIRPESGRFHQIRAQLAAAGWPIKGDVKYGARRGNRDRSIHLHAWKLAFPHPVTGDPCAYTVLPSAQDPVWSAFLTLLEEP